MIKTNKYVFTVSRRSVGVVFLSLLAHVVLQLFAWKMLLLCCVRRLQTARGACLFHLAVSLCFLTFFEGLWKIVSWWISMCEIHMQLRMNFTEISFGLILMSHRRPMLRFYLHVNMQGDLCKVEDVLKVFKLHRYAMWRNFIFRLLHPTWTYWMDATLNCRVIDIVQP